MELKNSKYGCNCILGGDLNTTMGENEKRGVFTIRDSSQENMEDLIINLNLFNVKPPKFFYT